MITTMSMVALTATLDVVNSIDNAFAKYQGTLEVKFNGFGNYYRLTLADEGRKLEVTVEPNSLEELSYKFSDMEHSFVSTIMGKGTLKELKRLLPQIFYKVEKFVEEPIKLLEAENQEGQTIASRYVYDL